MSQPWLPSYLGAYEELIKALLHNPFLDSGWEPSHPHPHTVMAMQRAAPEPSPWRNLSEPNPSPWRVAAASIIALAGVRQVANQMEEGRAKTEMLHDIERSSADIIDD
jgi:hypothetical protein